MIVLKLNYTGAISMDKAKDVMKSAVKHLKKDQKEAKSGIKRDKKLVKEMTHELHDKDSKKKMKKG